MKILKYIVSRENSIDEKKLEHGMIRLGIRPNRHKRNRSLFLKNLADHEDM